MTFTRNVSSDGSFRLGSVVSRLGARRRGSARGPASRAQRPVVQCVPTQWHSSPVAALAFRKYMAPLMTTINNKIPIDSAQPPISAVATLPAITPCKRRRSGGAPRAGKTHDEGVPSACSSIRSSIGCARQRRWGQLGQQIDVPVPVLLECYSQFRHRLPGPRSSDYTEAAASIVQIILPTYNRHGGPIPRH